MARKRLGKTLLERGQCGARRRAIRFAKRIERAEARVRLAAARRDPEAAAELSITPRQAQDREYTFDKRGAAERWLLAQVGRPWAIVAVEMRERFEVDRLSRYHLGIRCLLAHTHDRGTRVAAHSLFVDARGILRVSPAGPSSCA